MNNGFNILALLGLIALVLIFSTFLMSGLLISWFLILSFIKRIFKGGWVISWLFCRNSELTKKCESTPHTPSSINQNSLRSRTYSSNNNTKLPRALNWKVAIKKFSLFNLILGCLGLILISIIKFSGLPSIIIDLIKELVPLIGIDRACVTGLVHEIGEYLFSGFTVLVSKLGVKPLLELLGLSLENLNNLSSNSGQHSLRSLVKSFKDIISLLNGLEDRKIKAGMEDEFANPLDNDKIKPYNFADNTSSGSNSDGGASFHSSATNRSSENTTGQRPLQEGANLAPVVNNTSATGANNSSINSSNDTSTNTSDSNFSSNTFIKSKIENMQSCNGALHYAIHSETTLSRKLYVLLLESIKGEFANMEVQREYFKLLSPEQKATLDDIRFEIDLAKMRLQRQGGWNAIMDFESSRNINFIQTYNLHKELSVAPKSDKYTNSILSYLNSSNCNTSSNYIITYKAELEKHMQNKAILERDIENLIRLNRAFR